MNPGFIVTTGTPIPPSAEPEAVVVNDGWFPDMNPLHVREACRLDATVTPQRLRPVLMDAMLSVNAELQHWADEQRTRWGYAQLDDVPAPQVGGESAKLLYYRRAVHACVQADLVQTYRGMAALPTGNKLDRDNDDLQQHAADFRRQQRHAIADLLGRARSTVELL